LVALEVVGAIAAAAALVDEARQRGSEIVYFDMGHAPAAERVFGPITSYLLRERPCRIVIETAGPVRAVSDGQLSRNGVKAAVG
jgi:hypothetical protein